MMFEVTTVKFSKLWKILKSVFTELKGLCATENNVQIKNIWEKNRQQNQILETAIKMQRIFVRRANEEGSLFF